MQIRDACESDAEQLLEIYRPAVEESAISFELTVPSVDAFRERIASSSEPYPWIVAQRNDLLLGYAHLRSFRSKEAYCHSAETTVYVRHGLHGQGIGSTLMQELIRRARAVDHHLLIAGITVPNAASIGLHESLGFRQVGFFEEVGRKFDTWHNVGFWALKLEK